ncbi:MAG: hypothetical protein A2Z04_08920, partial [Chloroflexi bacterium RBG_16_57_9]
MNTMLSIEARLGLNVFAIDKQPHIVIHQEVCDAQCTLRPCLFVCPAKLYSIDAEKKMHVNFEGCLECGTCLIACQDRALEWVYPRAGYGVQY